MKIAIIFIIAALFSTSVLANDSEVQNSLCDGVMVQCFIGGKR